MKFTYDSAKNDSNLAKHGIPLSDAKLLNWDSPICWVDDRKNYGEERCVALALIKQRLYFVVYVELKISKRIISLRKANIREVERYEKENN
jgi:uncharacterized DUF497 family protein